MSVALSVSTIPRARVPRRRRPAAASACSAAASSAPRSRGGCCSRIPACCGRIAVRDPHKPRDVDWSDWSADPFAVVDDPEVGVVVECIGGVRLARELRAARDRARQRRRHRQQGADRARRAVAARVRGPHRRDAALRSRRRRGDPDPARARDRRSPTSRCSKSAAWSTARPTSCSRRWRAARAYADALAEAQRRGFAEADPRNDVEGIDAAHKLAILATLAFRRPVASAAFGGARITAIDPADVALAARTRLAAQAGRAGAPHGRRRRGRRHAGVRRARASVRAARTAPRTSCASSAERSGPLEFFGLGAGGDASASSVVGDIIAASKRAPMARPRAVAGSATRWPSRRCVCRWSCARRTAWKFAPRSRSTPCRPRRRERRPVSDPAVAGLAERWGCCATTKSPRSAAFDERREVGQAFEIFDFASSRGCIASSPRSSRSAARCWL